jgi:hypothetical protein
LCVVCIFNIYYKLSVDGEQAQWAIVGPTAATINKQGHKSREETPERRNSVAREYWKNMRIERTSVVANDERRRVRSTATSTPIAFADQHSERIANDVAVRPWCPIVPAKGNFKARCSEQESLSIGTVQ